MAQKTCSLQEVLSQIDALGEAAADPDSEDDFDGEWCDEDDFDGEWCDEDDFDGQWCDEDGDLNLHGGDVGCVCDVQSLLTGL